VNLRKPYLAKLSQLAVSDILGERPCKKLGKDELDALAGAIIKEAESLRFVYTAFDGDHQMFCSLMREAVIANGMVPANPDSVLGYKDTLGFRQSKQGVLLDDLSVLRGCDEIWIFTEHPALPESISKLAEGVLVELLYFLKRYPKRTVKFVKLSTLATGQSAPQAAEWALNYEETASFLDDSQRREILMLANSGLETDRRLRTVRYYLHDPLDYKYARFVRSEGYSESEIPLLPQLAVRAEDFADRSIALASVIVHWASLMRLASHCTGLRSLDSSRGPSQIVEVLERVWLRSLGSTSVVEGDWTRYKVPKASQKDRWAITQKERSTYEKA
jgi:hypothetical protein